MNLTGSAVNAIVVAAVGLGAVGLGGGVASAQPGTPLPLKPGNDIDRPCFPFCENRHGNNGNWNNNGN